MSATIAIANQKGGVAKTTTAVNLGYELALQGYNVTLLDLDPQASLSKNLLGEEELPRYKGIEELFLNDGLDPREFVAQTKIERLSLLPCHNELASVSAKILLDTGSFFAVKEILEKLTGYDVVIIDTPPSLGILTLNAFIACSSVLVPISPSVFSLMGVNDLLSSIEKAKKNLNPDLEILGVVLTMLDRRAALYCQIEGEVREFFKDKVFETIISRTVKSEEAALEGMGVSGLNPAHKIAAEYRSLTAEIIGRLGLSLTFPHQTGMVGSERKDISGKGEGV